MSNNNTGAAMAKSREEILKEEILKEEILKKVTVALGPPRWHPIKRRRWKRLMNTLPPNHWAAVSDMQSAQMAAHIQPLADQIASTISEQLPGSLEVKFDTSDIVTEKD